MWPAYCVCIMQGQTSPQPSSASMMWMVVVGQSRFHAAMINREIRMSTGNAVVLMPNQWLLPNLQSFDQWFDIDRFVVVESSEQ